MTDNKSARQIWGDNLRLKYLIHGGMSEFGFSRPQPNRTDALAIRDNTFGTN